MQLTAGCLSAGTYAFKQEDVLPIHLAKAKPVTWALTPVSPKHVELKLGGDLRARGGAGEPSSRREGGSGQHPASTEPGSSDVNSTTDSPM